MFKRAYTAAMPDEPAAVVNCLRVSVHLSSRLSARRVFARQSAHPKSHCIDIYFTLLLFRTSTAGASTCLLWIPPALIMPCGLCSLSWSPDMGSTAVLRSLDFLAQFTYLRTSVFWKTFFPVIWSFFPCYKLSWEMCVCKWRFNQTCGFHYQFGPRGCRVMCVNHMHHTLNPLHPRLYSNRFLLIKLRKLGNLKLWLWLSYHELRRSPYRAWQNSCRHWRGDTANTTTRTTATSMLPMSLRRCTACFCAPDSWYTWIPSKLFGLFGSHF